MATKQTVRVVSRVALLILVVLLGIWNVLGLQEAFGSGPPYYARTTNMDKWVNPLPMLATVDLAALALAACYLRLLKRKR